MVHVLEKSLVYSPYSMIRKGLTVCFIINLFIGGCLAQDSPQTKYAQLINEDSAKKHLMVIASDEFEGRETGKKGAEKAADYISKEFKNIGLKAPLNHSYFQAVPLATNKFLVKDFQVGNAHLISGQDFLIINSRKKNSVKSDEIIFIGYGISDKNYDDLKDIDITDKVVLLLNSDEPVNNKGQSIITGSSNKSAWSTSRNKRLNHVLAKKPKMVLAVSPDVDTLLNKIRQTKRDERVLLKEDILQQQAPEEKQSIVAYITIKTADLILKSSGNTYYGIKKKINTTGKPINLKINTSFKADYGTETLDVKAQNILGYLEGTDLKNELLIITAHYDHIGINPDGQINNGADDDGSGVTGVLEIANAFAKAKQEGHGPRRSILFMTVTGEEKGLLGSDYYTRYPVFPLDSTIANLNIDMIGRIDPPHFSTPEYVYLVGSDKLSSELHLLSERVNQTYTKLRLDYKYNDPDDPEKIYYRSDHYNFAKHNIPVIFYFNGVHEDYHNIGDTVDKIDFRLLTKRAQLVFYTAWDLANREKRPLVDSNKK
ncbi:Peptidase family M28 [Olivibacter domesticus]|uniref:Peptidase family M28 n=2 Tax=Olivibacter domesticus TaxID=407022 RepID=A0A1H7ZNB5_OLID1|nr:Peptidase family M28 [Olivibacter domesticus]